MQAVYKSCWDFAAVEIKFHKLLSPGFDVQRVQLHTRANLRFNIRPRSAASIRLEIMRFNFIIIIAE